MSHLRALLMVAILSLSLGSSCAEPWYEGEIRGLYGPQNASAAAEEGFNLVYRNRVYDRDDYLSDFRRLSLEAEEEGVTFIAGLYYLAGEVSFPYNRAVVHMGYADDHRPSPVDPVYWEKVVHETAIAVAQASLEYAIAGLVYDFEFYLGSGSGFNYGLEDDILSYSFDPPAVAAFAQSEGMEASGLAPNQTFPWLEEGALTSRYMEWQRSKVWEMARRTADAVYAINPDLSLGILGFQNSWHQWTILDAWNSERVPVTIWEEKSYWGHDPEYTMARLDLIEEHGLHCRYLPGLYSGVQSPRNIIRNMSQALSYCDAFWVFQYHHDTYGMGSLEEYHDAYKRFTALRGTWRILAGAAVAVLVLAGIALGAAALRGRWLSRGGPGGISCSGEPALDRCRTCRFMQSYGDGSFCTKLGIDLPYDQADGDREKGGG